MAMPANVTTVTVLGTFLTPEGNPSTGTVTFTPSSWLTNSGANVAIPNSSITKALGTAGDFSVTLPITDDPDLSPDNWVYTVSEVVDGVSQNYNILLPGTVAVGGTVYLADLVPAAPAGPEYYSLASSLTIGTVDTLAAGSSATASITGLAPSQTLNLGIPSGLTGVAGVNGSLNEPSVQQFAADGSVLRNLPARVIGAEQLLKQAVWWIDAAHSSATGQAVTNLGWGGTALNAQLGSTGTADSNDPRYLDWDGENYVYLPGAASNFLSVPDEANLDQTDDLDVRIRVALDDWTPAANTCLAAKWGGAGTRTWLLRVTTAGNLALLLSEDGTATASTATSSLATGISDGVASWVRATRDKAAGEVKFWTSTDGVSWSQLGTTVTGVTTNALFVSTSNVTFGVTGGNSEALAGKAYRAQILDGIDGPPVLDVDCSQIGSGSATSFTALTGQTVTINRSTSGRKAVAVTHPVWLFGTDDYMEVGDNDLIDFGASDSFTVLAVVRQWATQPNVTLLSHATSSAATMNGWAFVTDVAGSAPDFRVGDGATRIIAANPSASLGQVWTLAGVLRNGVTVDVSVNGGTPNTTADTLAGSVASTTPLRVGRDSFGAGYNDLEFIAAAIFRRALTSSEITTITNYYAGRIG